AERLAVRVGGQFDADAALLGQQRRVDIGDLVGHDIFEQAFERGELEDGDVLVRDLTVDLDLEVRDRGIGQRIDDPAEAFGQRDPGTHVLVDGPAGDVDRIGHEL